MSQDLDNLLSIQREYVTRMLAALAERDPRIAKQLHALASAGVTEYTEIKSSREGNTWRHEVHAIVNGREQMFQLTTFQTGLEAWQSDQSAPLTPKVH